MRRREEARQGPLQWRPGRRRQHWPPCCLQRQQHCLSTAGERQQQLSTRAWQHRSGPCVATHARGSSAPGSSEVARAPRPPRRRHRPELPARASLLLHSPRRPPPELPCAPPLHSPTQAAGRTTRAGVKLWLQAVLSVPLKVQLVQPVLPWPLGPSLPPNATCPWLAVPMKVQLVLLKSQPLLLLVPSLVQSSPPWPFGASPPPNVTFHQTPSPLRWQSVLPWPSGPSPPPNAICPRAAEPEGAAALTLPPVLPVNLLVEAGRLLPPQPQLLSWSPPPA